MRLLAVLSALSFLAWPAAASAQCHFTGVIQTYVCRSRSDHCFAVNDPVALALRTAQDASSALDAIGLYNDGLTLRNLGYDGTIECSLYSAARVDEVARHVRETAAQHASPERALLVVDQLDVADAAVQTAVRLRANTARATGAPPIVNLAGVMDPATAVFPTTFMHSASGAPWIVIRHPGELPAPDSNRAAQRADRHRARARVESRSPSVP